MQEDLQVKRQRIEHVVMWRVRERDETGERKERVRDTVAVA